MVLKKLHALIISLLFLGIFWYCSNVIFNYEIGGIDIPFIGHIEGWKPLADYSQYGGLAGGIFALILYYMLTKKGAKEL